MKHRGYIKTFLGDRLQIQEYKWWLKATSDGEKRNLEARAARLGVNLPIQGGTSTVMQSGFFNDVRESVKQGWRYPLQPIITVHDSNTCLLPTEMIFDIRKFYDINFTEFCASVGPRVRLLFDLMAGTRYESAIGMRQIDEDTIEFNGSADSCLEIYDKIMNCKYVKATCSMKREDIVPSYVTDAMQRFIIEEGTSIKKDESSYRVQFHRERV